MSTKIYDGCQVEISSTFELKQFCLRLRDLINPIRSELYHKKLARMLTTNIDRHQYDLPLSFLNKEKEKKEEFEDTHYWIVHDYMDDAIREIKIKQTRNPSFDYEFAVCFIPISSKTLAIPYTEQKEFRNIWYAQPEVIKYGYWNNVDPDEDCTDEEWNQREKDWDEALPNSSGIPAENGFSFEPFPYPPYHELTETLKYITDDMKRASSLAKDLMWKDFVPSITEEEKRQIYSTLQRFNKSIKGEKKDEFDRLEQEILGTLQPITKELILEKHTFKKSNYN